MKWHLLNFATVVDVWDGTVLIHDTDTANGLNPWSYIRGILLTKLVKIKLSWT